MHQRQGLAVHQHAPAKQAHAHILSNTQERLFFGSNILEMHVCFTEYRLAHSAACLFPSTDLLRPVRPFLCTCLHSERDQSAVVELHISPSLCTVAETSESPHRHRPVYARPCARQPLTSGLLGSRKERKSLQPIFFCVAAFDQLCSEPGTAPALLDG